MFKKKSCVVYVKKEKNNFGILINKTEANQACILFLLQSPLMSSVRAVCAMYEGIVSESINKKKKIYTMKK